MGGLDLLEFRDKLLFTAGVAIRVPLEGELAESLSDITFISVGRHPEVLVVVSRRIHLHHVGDGSCDLSWAQLAES